MEQINIWVKLNYFNPDSSNFNPIDWLEVYWLDKCEDFNLNKLASSNESVWLKIKKLILEEIEYLDICSYKYNRLSQHIWMYMWHKEFVLQYKKSWRWYSLYLYFLNWEDD